MNHEGQPNLLSLSLHFIIYYLFKLSESAVSSTTSACVLVGRVETQVQEL